MRFPKSYIDYATNAVENPALEDALTFEDFVASCMERDPSGAIENRRRKNPDWPEDWLEGHVRLRWICDSNGWLIRGVERRIVSANVDELQLFLEMHVRSRFHWYYKNDEEYTEIWALLTALAIDDRVTIDRHCSFATFPLVNSRGGEAARLFNAVHQLLRDPTTRPEDLDLRSTKSCAGWLRACLQLIDAFVRRDNDIAEDAFQALLKGFRKTPQINLMEKAIAFCALGLFRLGAEIAPEVKLTSPTDLKLPWDSDLFHASTDRQLISYGHFPHVPQWLTESIVDLKPLPWQTEQ